MTPYTLFVFALRLMGFWLLVVMVDGVGQMIGALYTIVDMFGRPNDGQRVLPSAGSVAIALLVPPILQGIAALALVLAAPRIAALFYDCNENKQTLAISDRPAIDRACQIAMRLLGLYALLLAIRPVAAGVSWLGEPYWRVHRNLLSAAIEAGLYLAAAGILLFGATRLVRWFAPAEKGQSGESKPGRS